MPPAAEPPGPAAGRLAGLLLDIGGVVHNTGVRMVGRLAEREPAMRPVIEKIGGIASDRDELWQQMLRRQIGEREYWAQRAAELGAAIGKRTGKHEHWVDAGHLGVDRDGNGSGRRGRDQRQTALA